MKKQILAMVLTLCMVVSMLPAKALAVSDFSDMPNDYSTEALQNAVKNGLLGGSDGKIMANDNLTRAQMAAVLVRAFGADKAADLTAFTDVTPDAWYYTELSSAVYMGIIKGDGATMRPNAPITRQEALVVLARAYGLETENTSNLDQFSDKASIGEWAKSGVAAMIASGLVKGDGANLNPLSNISRKEFAVVMDRMVETYIKESGTVTTLPDGSVVINKPHVTLKGVTVKGNLIIGDGVGDGGVTLDCVNVEGNIVVRGGGAFVVKGNSSLGKVIISKVDGNVRVAAEVSAEVEVIAINDGKNDVVIEGKANKLETYSATPVRLRNAIIKEVSVATPNAEVTVGEGTKVETVTVAETAKVTSLEVSKDATVTTVYVAGESIRIDGDGRVENVNVTGNNVIVNTEGTKVIAAENVSGVLAGGIEVKPNQIVTTPVKKPSTGGSSSGGSSSIKYTVTFDSNGGTKVTSQTVISGDTAKEPTAPKKASSLFKGWYADAECKIPFNFDTAIVANTTVYAKWMTKEECQQAVNNHFANGLNLTGLTVDEAYNLSPAFDASITSYTASTYDGVFKFKPKFEVGKGEINIEGLGTYQVTTDIMVSLDENSDGISGNLAGGYTIKKAEGTEDKKLTITTKAEVFVKDYGSFGSTFVANKVYTITLKTPATSGPYTVTFNSNGGTKVTSQTVISGDTAKEPTAPKKASSLFKGWYADAECKIPFNFDTAIVANTTVYAKWMTKEECQQAVNNHFANGLNLTGLTVDEAYNLSPAFDASITSYTASTKDGVFKFKPKFEVGKSEIKIEGLGTYQVTTDIMVSLDENSDGISGNLAGGYTIKKAEGTEDKKLTITTKAEVFVKDYGSFGSTFVANKVYTITLKTPATSGPYTVTFNSNGGTKVTSQTVISGDTAKEPTAPKKASSLFKGWYADAECKIPFNFDTAIVANTTVYAKWMTKEECQQAVNNHFANGLNLTGLTVDEAYNLSPAFDASITSYTASTKDGVFKFKPKFEVGKGEINIEGLGTYQVTTDIMVSLDENSDGISGNLAGGYTIKKAEGTEDKKLTITTKAEVFVKDYGSFGSTFVANKVYTITLKTPATSGPYTVTFNSNGGTKVTSQTVISGDTAKEPTAPKKASSLFKGWYADAECKIPFNFDTAIVANTTVYAKWMTKEECQQAVNNHFANGLNLTGLTVDEAYNLSPAFDASITSYTASTKDGVFKFKPKFEVGKGEINIEGLGTYQVTTDIMVSLDENSDGISGNLAGGYTIKKAEGTEDKKLTITTKAEVFVKDYGSFGSTFVANKVYTITLKTPAPYTVTDLTLANRNNSVFRVRKSDGEYIQSSQLYNSSIYGPATYYVKLSMGLLGRNEARKAEQITD